MFQTNLSFKDSLSKLGLLDNKVIDNVGKAIDELSKKGDLLATLSKMISHTETPLLYAGVVMQIADSLHYKDPTADSKTTWSANELHERSRILKIASLPNGSFDYGKLIKDIENSPTPQALRLGLDHNIANIIFKSAEKLGKINSTLRNFYVATELNELLFPDIDRKYPKYSIMLQPNLYTWKQLSEATTKEGLLLDFTPSESIYLRLIAVVVENENIRTAPRHIIDLFTSLDPHRTGTPISDRSLSGNTPVIESNKVPVGRKRGSPFSADSEEIFLRLLGHAAQIQGKDNDAWVRQVIELDAEIRGLLTKKTSPNASTIAGNVLKLRRCFEAIRGDANSDSPHVALSIFKPLKVSIPAAEKMLRGVVTKWFGCQIVDSANDADLVIQELERIDSREKDSTALLKLTKHQDELDIATIIALRLAEVAHSKYGEAWIVKIKGSPEVSSALDIAFTDWSSSLT